MYHFFLHRVVGERGGGCEVVMRCNVMRCNALYANDITSSAHLHQFNHFNHIHHITSPHVTSLHFTSLHFKKKKKANKQTTKFNSSVSSRHKRHSLSFIHPHLHPHLHLHLPPPTHLRTSPTRLNQSTATWYIIQKRHGPKRFRGGTSTTSLHVSGPSPR